MTATPTPGAAAKLPVVASMRKGCTAADDPLHNVFFVPSDHRNWVNLTPHAPAQAQLDALRAEVARLTKERDAAFAMSRCECSADAAMSQSDAGKNKL